MNNDSEEKHRKDLKVAKNWYKIAEQQNNEVAMNILKDLFPELSESRNIGIQLVNAIKSSARLEDCLQKHGFEINEVIAWLEKQCEKRYTWSEEDENVINHLLAICAGAKRYRQFAGCLQDDITKYQNWLKSLEDRGIPQSKQEWSEEDMKFIDALDNCINELKEKCGWNYVYVVDNDIPMSEIVNWLKSLKDKVQPQPKQEWSEEQGEQKPTDEVKPKFKVGDWIVSKTNKMYQVLCVIDGEYRLSSNIDGSIVCAEAKTIDKKYHTWTIEDAKNGDVLSYVTDEGGLWIMIYKSLYEHYEGHVHYHALILNNDFINRGTCYISVEDLNPATKEQRDLLFQKMKEAGYEWDAEKKELNTIEHRSLSTEETELNSLAFLTELGYTCIPPTKENHKWNEEDKKIRKELHKYFHDLQLSSDREFSPSTSIDEILAWLEKQDEQIKDNKEEIIYLKGDILYEKNMDDYSSEIIGFLKNYIKAYGCTAMNSWVNWLEEQCHGGKKWIYEDTYIKDKEQTFQDGIDEVLENPQKYGLEKQQDNNEDSNILQRFSFYSYKDELNILYLSGLYVNKECRNKGIGTKILEVADEVAKSLNCHAIRLKTRKDSNAERLYRAHGYNSLATEERDEIWLEKQCEKRYTWSEEDIRNIQDIDSILFYDRLLTEDIRTKLRNFLKSLKYRVQPQYNQEWSEEDIKMLNEIVLDLKLLKNKDTGEEGKAAYQREIDWLKSLKPQNHWKPSEEQILSLQEAISVVGENSISGRNLIEISEQLKNFES